MALRQGKFAVGSTMSLTILVLILGVIASKDLLREEWFLRQLASDYPDEQCRSADRLGQLNSARAVPRLVELLKKEPLKDLDPSIVAMALIHIGSPAVLALLEEYDAGPLVNSSVDSILRQLGPEAVPGFVNAIE